MNKIEEMQHLQKVPMPGERQVIWAVQSKDDATTRQALPFWVSEPIARRVAIWADQNRVWEDKIDSRMLRGLHLTRVQQENYDRWKQDHQVQTLVFSKRTGSQVIRLKADTDIRTVEGDLFSIKVSMSADPDELTVQAGNGEIQRLVVLRGEASQEAKIPGCLDHGLAPGALAEDFNDDEKQDEVDGQEPDPDQQEQEALEIADKLEESDCGEEINVLHRRRGRARTGRKAHSSEILQPSGKLLSSGEARCDTASGWVNPLRLPSKQAERGRVTMLEDLWD